MKKPATIDEYISGFPGDVQRMLEEVRTTIGKAAPKAEERISWGMPTFALNGKYLVYFAAYKKHISIYPAPSGNPLFDKAFAKYKTSGKGTVQFPIDQTMPLSLIAKIVKFRMKQRLAKEKAGKKKVVKKK